jgi:hypothetical protein
METKINSKKKELWYLTLIFLAFNIECYLDNSKRLHNIKKISFFMPVNLIIFK